MCLSAVYDDGTGLQPTPWSLLTISTMPSVSQREQEDWILELILINDSLLIQFSLHCLRTFLDTRRRHHCQCPWDHRERSWASVRRCVTLSHDWHLINMAIPRLHLSINTSQHSPENADNNGYKLFSMLSSFKKHLKVMSPATLQEVRWDQKSKLKSVFPNGLWCVCYINIGAACLMAGVRVIQGCWPGDTTLRLTTPHTNSNYHYLIIQSIL